MLKIIDSQGFTVDLYQNLDTFSIASTTGITAWNYLSTFVCFQYFTGHLFGEPTSF